VDAMQNVEIKIELRDPALARAIVSTLGAPRVARLRQVDTYYRLADGRLKKRETTDERGHVYPPEYIFYHRLNQARARVSRFVIYTAEEARRLFGAQEPPVWVRVSKWRDVYMHKGVRVHLDEVEDLGSFVEFEALVTPQNDLKAAHAAVEELRRALGPALGEPVSVSYSDLLAAEPTA
jgi:adenylate cyclase class 2